MTNVCKSGLTFSILVCLFAFSFAPASEGASGEPQPDSLATVFEKNLGQAPSPYRFISRHSSVDAFFLDKGVDLVLPSKDASRHRVRFNLLGIRPDLVPEGGTLLPAASNYLLGSDPSHWIRGVPNHAQVVYRQVYPGIDLVFHGQNNEMEHDFQIAPGADPGKISFTLEGADTVGLDSFGNLMISFGDDTLLLQKPQAYQQTPRGRQIIESHFMLKHDRSVQFQLGSYDRKLELIIDPVFIFSTYLASSSGDSPMAITSDSAGNVYVTGYTDGLDFPLENGIQTTVTGSPNVFVSKLDPTGHTLLYSTYLGGSSRNYGNAIAIDASGDIIVAGTSASNDFPHAGSVPSLTCEGNNDCYFLVSLKPDGSAFNYAGLIGGIEGTDAQSSGGPGAGNIALDSAGNTFLTGITDDPNFEITPGTLATGVQGGGYPYNSTFIMKVSPAGKLIYSTIVPGTAQQDVIVYLNNVFVAAGISVDGNGQATIAGTAGPGLPSTAGVIQSTFPNNLSNQNASAGFVLQVNAAASVITYATYVPGTDSIGGYAVDGQGDSYVTGGTSETNLPVSSNAYQKTLKAGQNCTCNSGFLLKLNKTGTAVVAATYLEGTPPTGNEGTNFTGLARQQLERIRRRDEWVHRFPARQSFHQPMGLRRVCIRHGSRRDVSRLEFCAFRQLSEFYGSGVPSLEFRRGRRRCSKPASNSRSNAHHRLPNHARELSANSTKTGRPCVRRQSRHGYTGSVSLSRLVEREFWLRYCEAVQYSSCPPNELWQCPAGDCEPHILLCNGHGTADLWQFYSAGCCLPALSCLHTDRQL